MHTFYTIRFPPPAPQRGLVEYQPIRVTNKAMESLLFCIVHTIEFQSPLQPIKQQVPSPGGTSGKGSGSRNEEYVSPVVSSSTLLGNVTYVARNEHNPSVLVSLRSAVEAARAIQIPEKSNEVPFELRVRLLRRQRGWFWCELRPLVEWVFRMIKTREELSFPAVHSDATERARQKSLPGTAPVRRTSASKGGQGRVQEEGIVYSNDPGQIRQVLKFIVKKSYEDIELNTYADFRSGELVFDISVQEVS
ncbi:hypothetical protein DQ04_01191020 [Trypanosoma grayi]|uniref:hypothetical protein n=1 Tax=Trypanosoma grayi TaxID=71804 RepID=UPI0004F48FB0|nr:hypothetical protein DQ04_01191020 [Trypanosoma grayi]KEG13134.1 hypothetical protein DQ04_01191020 [Trypanosoma grayi]